MKTLCFSLLVLTALTAQAGPKPEVKTTPVNKHGALAAATVGELTKSVYEIPPSPKEGRNPFFPNSNMGQPAASVATTDKPGQKAKPEPNMVFVLNGITSPPRRTAMINGRTFEPGEEGEIKLPTGSKVLIKCEEIGDNSAVIVVGGVKRELRLRFPL